jgi:hypothetical protein
LQHPPRGIATSPATWRRIGPLRRFIDEDDDTGGERLLFDPIDDRDRQGHLRRPHW